jgi:uncharacterized cupredoxin-like copper-binding protein
MIKPLSAQLADLSVKAKNAEDAAATAQKQAHDKAVVLREQARASATAAIEKLNQDIKSAGGNITSQWNALKTKVAADMDAWNAKVGQLKHEISAKQSEKHAEWLEWEASFAIDYAKAAIEEAKSAVLDAIVARIEAEKAKSA